MAEDSFGNTRAMMEDMIAKLPQVQFARSEITFNRCCPCKPESFGTIKASGSGNTVRNSCCGCCEAYSNGTEELGISTYAREPPGEGN